MPSYVATEYNKLSERKDRVIQFFGELDSQLLALSVAPTVHQDIYWDGNFVKIILTDSKLVNETPAEQLKYYNQGLGLMKIALNKSLYV
jgi:hypothetical protein